ncbi:RidA family protein [Constantimarinum furrinae]|uniref:Translation initiation inhibitor n=1 Tax=Constantimarinum furrinae TaxID=2562285 RepID=A0A7G8PXD6_9FLAO|nr:Rid family hydrolase [Constantimarinum furrinae]QNJ99002.1 Translation initiation inhibitor [Constantimarinum furrinae]
MKLTKPTHRLLLFVSIVFFSLLMQSCMENDTKETPAAVTTEVEVEKKQDKPEYFLLRPEVEKAYGYSHAVKIGNEIKISGAVSMDDAGNPTAVGDMAQQMKNCYADIEKILKHFNCTFDDVVVENIYTTNMASLLESAAYRNEIYKNHYPTATWVGVTELALPQFMIEIELEVYKAD